MICSGEQTNFIYSVAQEDTASILAVIDCIEHNRVGTLQMSESGIAFSNANPEYDFYFNHASAPGGEWLYREKIGYQHHIHIIGAGHCALALSRVMRMLDFYVSVYDDRCELKTFTSNVYAHQKVVLGDYSTIGEQIKEADPFVVVMTVGYRTDDMVIRTLFTRPFRYLGVLGSSKKIEKMFAAYRQEGIDEKLLKRIHAPIGITINSRTPEEIAISIAAEIISVKNTATG